MNGVVSHIYAAHIDLPAFDESTKFVPLFDGQESMLCEITSYECREDGSIYVEFIASDGTLRQRTLQAHNYVFLTNYEEYPVD